MLARWPSAVLALASDIEWFVLHPWVVGLAIGAPSGIVAGRRGRAAQLRKRRFQARSPTAEPTPSALGDGVVDKDAAAVKTAPTEAAGGQTWLDRLDVRKMSKRGVRTYAIAMGLVMALETLMRVALRPRPIRLWSVILSTTGSLVTSVGVVYMVRGFGNMANAWQGRTDEERRAMVQDWMRRMAEKYGDGAACAVDATSGDPPGDSPA